MRNLIIWTLLGLGIIAILVLLPTLSLAWGWNFFVSPVFGLPQIDFWNALAGWGLAAFLRFSFIPFFKPRSANVVMPSTTMTKEQREAMAAATEGLKRLIVEDSAERAARAERAAGRRDN